MAIPHNNDKAIICYNMKAKGNKVKIENIDYHKHKARAKGKIKYIAGWLFAMYMNKKDYCKHTVSLFHNKN